MKRQVLIVVKEDKLQEVMKALKKVSNARAHTAVVVDIRGENTAEAILVAMLSGASSAFEI